MKTEMTVQQAITLYTVIEALRNQFDADNLRRQQKEQNENKDHTENPAKEV